MKFEYFSKTIQEYRWVLIASVFFIFWKFFLISLLWHGRAIAPEPDDSYEYIANIASVSTCTSGITCPYPGVSLLDHSGFSYLSYRIFFGAIGRIFSLFPETMYHASFFIGTLFLIPVIIFFLHALTTNRKKIAWAMLFLAFYHGTGETHGFFWVVPSFFSTLLFFLLFALVTVKRPFPYFLSGIVAITYTFAHPTSVYIIFIIPLFLLFSLILSKTFDKESIKGTIFVIAATITSAIFQTVYLQSISQENYYGIGQSMKNAQELVENTLSTHSGNTAKKTVSIPPEIGGAHGYSITKAVYVNIISQRIASMQFTYFRYIIPHWTVVFLLIFAFLLLFWKREYAVLSLYFASLLFFITATILNEFGFRSAIILWPATFIFFAFASWHFIGMLKGINNPLLQKAFLSFFFLGVLAFFMLNMLLSIVFNMNMNTRYNYILNEQFASYLMKKVRSGNTVSLTPILVRTGGGAELYASGHVVSSDKQPDYLAVIDSSGYPIQKTDTFSCSMARRLVSPLGISIQPFSQATPYETPVGYTFDQEFDAIKIYRKVR